MGSHFGILVVALVVTVLAVAVGGLSLLSVLPVLWPQLRGSSVARAPSPPTVRPAATARPRATVVYPQTPAGGAFRLTFDENAFPAEYFEEKGLPDYAEYWDSRLVAGRVKVRGGKVRIASMAADWDGTRFTSGGVASLAFTGYGDYTFRLKASAMPGVVTALYLYNETKDLSLGGRHEEIDVELSGALHPGKASIVSYHNAPAGVSDDTGTDQFAGGIMDLRRFSGLQRFNAAVFNTYHIRYRPGEIVWRVNGREVYRTRRAVPAAPMQLHFDTYHNVGWDDFTTTPPEGAGAAELDSLSFTPL